MVRQGLPHGVAIVVAALGSIVSAHTSFAVDCSTPSTTSGTSQGNVFTITTTGFTSSEVQTATTYWGCPGYSGEIPTFQVGGSGGIPVLIVKKVGNSTTAGGGCGLFDPEIVNGHLESAEITIWTNQKDGTSCEPLTDSIAHELGHLMGLADATDPNGACLNHIMGGRIVGGTRTVQADDCEVADAKWETSWESDPATDPYCDAYCWTSCVNNACPDGNPWCPILVDMENDGFHLTGLDDPVWFDIDADGMPDLMSWTDRSEGLLALDRNGNGWIDDGSELFGNATRLADGSRALNGYLALAELDSWIFGGNGDGAIDAADPAFSSLRMWTDHNHDGVSQPEELQTLDEAGIQRISLEYKRSNRTDRYGNQFRFLGRAWKARRNGAVRPVVTWDVFFLTVP